VGTSHMNDGRQTYVSGTQLVDPLSMVTPNLSILVLTIKWCNSQESRLISVIVSVHHRQPHRTNL
jgi:hypothetical protein